MRISGCSAQGSAPRQFLAMLMPRSPVQTPGKRGGKRLPQGLLRESYLAEVGLKPIFILALGVELVGLGCDLDPMHRDEPTRLPGDAGAPRARRLALKIHAFSGCLLFFLLTQVALWRKSLPSACAQIWDPSTIWDIPWFEKKNLQILP